MQGVPDDSRYVPHIPLRPASQSLATDIRMCSPTLRWLRGNRPMHNGFRLNKLHRFPLERIFRTNRLSAFFTRCAFLSTRNWENSTSHYPISQIVNLVGLQLLVQAMVRCAQSLRNARDVGAAVEFLKNRCVFEFRGGYCLLLIGRLSHALNLARECPSESGGSSRAFDWHRPGCLGV